MLKARVTHCSKKGSSDAFAAGCFSWVGSLQNCFYIFDLGQKVDFADIYSYKHLDNDLQDAEFSWEHLRSGDSPDAGSNDDYRLTHERRVYLTYITVMQSPRYHQITLDELLNGINDISNYVNPMSSNTRTYVVSSVNEKRLEQINVASLITVLKDFNRRHANLFEVERHNLYQSFYIPKKSGGLRKIDAPENELMEALRQLKWIFETQFTALYHTSAFAYIHGRCTIDAIKKKQ